MYVVSEAVIKYQLVAELEKKSEITQIITCSGVKPSPIADSEVCRQRGI